MIQSNMKILSRTRKQIRSFSSQNWIYRNVKESLDGVNVKTETKNAIGIFFKKFYTDLEKSTELVETLKECRRETAKKENGSFSSRWHPLLVLSPSLEESYEAEAPRTVLKPSLSSNGA
ncbi:hypothetical protein Tco_0827161 [Tanacetum coccineum]